MEKLEPSYHAGENASGAATVANGLVLPLLDKHRTAYDPANLSLPAYSTNKRSPLLS